MFEIADPKNYVLYVEDLSMNYTVSGKKVRALRNVTFGLKEHESVGIVGESGCGKSTLAMAISHVLPQNTEIVGGRIYFKGEVIADAGMGGHFSLRPDRKQNKVEKKLTHVRWGGISIVFQGALDSLNPLHTIKEQIGDIFVHKKKMTRDEAKIETLELLNSMGLDDWVIDAYPHQLSGGMKQRVVIAMAMTLKPSLIIADEPTTSLDVITEYRIIEELQKLREKYRISIVNISHDISLVSHLSDRIMVMYAGKLVEKIPTNKFDNVQHPYTSLLINSMPSLVRTGRKVVSIKGAPPSLVDEISGCAFAERCNYVQQTCRDEGADKEQSLDKGRIVRCAVLPFRSKKDIRGELEQERLVSIQNLGRHEVLSVTDLRKVFKKRAGIRTKALFGDDESDFLVAVDNVNFSMFAGESVSLVGETGSGKTTISRIIGLLDNPTSGKVTVGDEEVNFDDAKEIRSHRKTIQTIFQDPFQSINPRHSVFNIVSEPLIVNRLESDQAVMLQKVKDALTTVGLTPSEDYIKKYPHQLSGGQRQRVAIARSLILEPEIIIADEPISMLDVSLRAGVLNLLRDMQKERNVALFYITHDIASARYVSNRIMVLYRGQIVEMGDSEEVIKNSSHPYTIALVLASIGVEGDLGGVLGERIFADQSTASTTGCRFSNRCPIAKDRCREEEPPLREVVNGHFSRCHYGAEINSVISKEAKREDKEVIQDMFREVLSGFL